jgi:hypothetical protein
LAGGVTLPFAWFVGVASWTLVLLGIAAWVVAAAIAFVAGKRPQRHVPLTFVAGVGAAFVSSFGTGPLLQIPIIVTLSVAAIVVTARQANPRWALVIGIAAIVSAAVLSAFGLHPVATSFDGAMLHHSGGAFVWSWRLYAAVTVLFVLEMIFTAQFFGAHRAAREAAEATTAIQKWQVRQLLPDEALAREDAIRASHRGKETQPRSGS